MQMTDRVPGEGPEGTEGEGPILTVEFASTASLCVLTLTGDLNGSSIAALEVQIDQIGCSMCSRVVINVCALRNVDSVGVRVLVGLDNYVRALGARSVITGATGKVAEVLACAPLMLDPVLRSAVPSPTVRG
jgi:anti-anti-sigma factor